jgi:hypothetical protein
MAGNDSRSEWKGIDLATACRIEQLLCRPWPRIEMFYESRNGGVMTDATARTASVLNHLLGMLDRWGVGKPSNRQIANAIPGVTETSLSRLLNNVSAGTTPWFDKIESIVIMVIAGADLRNADPHVLEVAKRIAEYFFREIDKSSRVPRYFRGLQAWSPDPWSATELAQEVQWLARQARLVEDKPHRLVVCSGYERLVHGDQFRSVVAEATVEAIRAKVDTTFVVGDHTDAANSLQFLLQHAKSKLTGGALGIVRLTDESPVVARAYAARAMEFMYFDTFEEGKRKQYLYAIRGKFYGSADTALQPLAITCNAEEAAEFGTWFDSLPGQGVVATRHSFAPPDAPSATIAPIGPAPVKPPPGPVKAENLLDKDADKRIGG